MLELPVRDALRGLSPYGAPQLELPVLLNTNENPHPPPAALVAELAQVVGDVGGALNRYPDRDAVDLRGDLARYLTDRTGAPLTVDQVWAANGSNEVLQQLLQVFAGPGRRALGFEPSYSMHRLISLATATGWVDGYRADDFTLDPARVLAQIDEHAPDVVFLASPNNPTGTALELATVEAVCAAAPGMVVVDEAYAEFARPGTRSAVTLLAEHPRLVVTRTMSKAFAMAGTRLGYLAASPAVVDAVQLVRLPYHLSSLTQAAARVALRHTDALLGTVDEVKAQRDRIVEQLAVLGCPTVPSDANFVLFGVDDSAAVWQALVDRGVLVRDLGLPGWLRVTAGTEVETSTFLQALAAVLAA